MIGKTMQGQNVLITGTARGITRATVADVASRGGNVWASTRTLPPEWQGFLSTQSREYGVNATPVLLDVTKPESIKAASRRSRRVGSR